MKILKFINQWYNEIIIGMCIGYHYYVNSIVNNFSLYEFAHQNVEDMSVVSLYFIIYIITLPILIRLKNITNGQYIR